MTPESLRDQFVRATYHSLLAFVLRMVRDSATAEDIAQTAYEQVFRDPTFDPSRPDAVGFLKQNARWRAQEHRRQSRRKPGSLPAGLSDSGAGQPDQTMEREEVRQRVGRAVDQLPAAQRVIMVRHLSGMEHEQVAADLQLPVKLVYSRFHNGKAALRRLLENDGLAVG